MMTGETRTTVTEDEKAWNPHAAFVMHFRELRERSWSSEFAQSLERTPDPQAHSKEATIHPVGASAITFTMPEYIAWLDQQADLAHAEMERFGGMAAVEEFRTDLEARAREVGQEPFYSDGTPVNPDLRPDMTPLPVPEHTPDVISV